MNTQQNVDCLTLLLLFLSIYLVLNISLTLFCVLMLDVDGMLTHATLFIIPYLFMFVPVHAIYKHEISELKRQNNTTVNMVA